MYSKSITSSSRALFVIAIDQSASMAGEVNVDGVVITKAEMVARVANDLVSELVERSRRTNGVRDYYDVAIVGYGDDSVQWLLGEPWVSITELDGRCCEESQILTSCRVDGGAHYLYEQNVRS